MIVDKINAYLSWTGEEVSKAIADEVAQLAAFAFIRQFGKREDRSKIGKAWFSSIGSCIRKQAYDYLGFEPDGKEIDSRAKMVFFQGDLVELAVLALAKQAGCHIRATGFEQERIEYNGMTGRPDGILTDGDISNPIESISYLVEVKSMSSYRFADFERGVIDEGHTYQCNAGMAALKLDSCVLVGFNKDAGVLAEQIIKRDDAIVAEIDHRLATLKHATQENLPERPFAPNEKGILPWNCLYCAHWKTCWPNAERVLVGKGYKLKLKGD